MYTINHVSVALMLFSSILLASCEPSAPVESAVAPPVPESADLVLTGGRISTVDPAFGEQQAIAIRGFRIAAVADDATIAKYVGPKTQVIELQGRRVVPGFIEGHGHYMSFGQSQQILDLSTAQNWDQIVGQVAVAVDGARPGDWIFGRGWHQEKWNTSATGLNDEVVEGVPVNDSLNVVSADNPVYLVHASGHAAYANAAALAAAGIDENSTDPAGGTIVRRDNGHPSGLLRENAQDAVESTIAIYDQRLPTQERQARLREQSRLAAQQALRHGVTSFHDAGASFATIDFLKILEAEGALPVRLYVMVRGETNAELATKLPGYRMLAEDNDFLTVRAIKRQIDGALGAHGAWLLEPYEDMPNSTGLVLETIVDIERSAELALEHGYQINTHAIGTRANRETLDLYQRVWQQGQANGQQLRWRIEHAQHIHPEDVPRFGKLGVIAAMQGIHCASDGPWIAARLGESRAGTTSYPWRSLIEGGAVIGNGTDVPVEPIDPIASFLASVTRTTITGDAFYPQHTLTRTEALASYTINNAYAAFEEALKGSLTPGKLADLVVLSDDIMTVPAEQIGNAVVDLTVVGGEIRYARTD